jgi:hypothetical protein
MLWVAWMTAVRFTQHVCNRQPAFPLLHAHFSGIKNHLYLLMSLRFGAIIIFIFVSRNANLTGKKAA